VTWLLQKLADLCHDVDFVEIDNFVVIRRGRDYLGIELGREVEVGKQLQVVLPPALTVLRIRVRNDFIEVDVPRCQAVHPQ
jgi:hypothetical protein